MREPDITAEVVLARSEDGGRAGPILSKHFGCILVVNDVACDVRIRLEGSFDPGERRVVGIDFLYPDAACTLRPGMRFILQELREIASGVVLTVQAEHVLS